MISLKSLPWALVALLAAMAAVQCLNDEKTDAEYEAETETSGEPLNLFGPLDVDEDVDLPMVPLGDEPMMLGDPVDDQQQDQLAEDVAQVQPQAEQSEEAAEVVPTPAESPAVWKEPENEMTLIRFFHGRYYQSQYNTINNVLIKEVDSTSVEANMAYVLEWLARERKRGVSWLNQATVEALQQVADLNTLNEANRCNRDSYAILVRNDRATKGRAHRAPSELTPPRRIESLVHQVSLKHAVECFNEYPANYVKVRDTQLDQTARKIVESFMDSIIEDPNAVSSKVKAIKGKKAAKLAYNSIMTYGMGDPNLRFMGKVVDERRGKLWVAGEGVRGLVKKYLVQPCQAFTQALGPDVFIPARFDALMLEKEDRYSAKSREMAEFMHGWIQYRLCDLLIKRDEFTLTKHIVWYIYSITKDQK